jgi:hypothetical protein
MEGLECGIIVMELRTDHELEALLMHRVMAWGRPKGKILRGRIQQYNWRSPTGHSDALCFDTTLGNISSVPGLTQVEAGII